MNGIQFNGKSRGYQKSAPGCLGRMVNLFDLTSNVSGNRLLTNKPHNDGSSLSRSQSYDSAFPSFGGDEMEDGVVSEFRRSSPVKKPNGTPVKMLMAQEMSQDSDSRQNSPNVVARLMGLDALPQQHPDSGIQNRSQCYSRKSHSEKPNGYWEEGRHGLFNNHVDHGMDPSQEQSECRAIYEIWQQSQLKNGRRDKSPQKGRCNENINEKKMALIRQKFVEAKRLATDENLRQTKEFRDALDVLSSNGELFLKVLQEPSSLISPPETKRITVLKPSKMVVDDKFATLAKRNEKQVKKQQPLVNHVSVWDSHNGFPPTMSAWKANDTPAQPTRIVVLKPSPGRVNNIVKPVVSSTLSSPRTLQRGNVFEETEHEDGQEAREVAKEITLRMRENLAGHRRDETLLSSVLSNGYTGDESSFEKSDGAGNLSDSEVMSPTSRHSWDYVNRYGSPCSSSFSRASFSPESSVCREAKKRLSERWAMMASNGSSLEQRHVRRSSSTLGEMLALSGINNSEICEEGGEANNNRGVQDPRASTSCLRESGGDESPKNLSRSKSVPVTSTVYGGRLNVELSDPVLSKKDGSMEAIKAKPAKTTSFAGKVTSLFFSRNKKTRNDEQSSKPQSSHDELQSVHAETSGNSGFPGMTRNESSDVGLSPAALGQRILSNQQGVLSVSQPAVPGIHGENQDQPSPISVLEPLFEEERVTTLNCSYRIEPNPYGGKQISSSCLSRSNLIDKSPPIGSIARTLSWDECSAETAGSYPLNSPFHILSPPGTEENEAELRSLVQSLLTMAGFDQEGQVDEPHLARWHSPDSPLDPLLRDKYVDLTAKEQPGLHEGKLRQLRSTRKLVFDGVNEALLDIGACQWKTMGAHHSWAHCMALVDGPGEVLADKVWARMKEWFSEDVNLVSVSAGEESCSGDYNSLVERVVKKEVGKGWGDQMRVEVDKIGKEIEGELIQELVEESVVQFTGRE